MGHLIPACELERRRAIKLDREPSPYLSWVWPWCAWIEQPMEHELIKFTPKDKPKPVQGPKPPSKPSGKRKRKC